MIKSSGMGRPNQDMDVTTESSMFQTLYDDDHGGVSDVMLGQGSWSDRRALEERSIIGRQACDG